jgi:hypothetical protein
MDLKTVGLLGIFMMSGWLLTQAEQLQSKLNTHIVNPVRDKVHFFDAHRCEWLKYGTRRERFTMYCGGWQELNQLYDKNHSGINKNTTITCGALIFERKIAKNDFYLMKTLAVIILGRIVRKD